jgi:TPR repeat protein
MTKYCPNCKIEVEVGNFCPECGTKLDDIQLELFCPECGKVFDHGKFCSECGVKLEERKKIEKAPKTVTAPSLYQSSLGCPACGYENPAGSKVCVTCGFPLEITVDDNSVSSDISTASEDETILAKYTDEYGEVRDLNDEEISVALDEIKTIARKGNAKAETMLAWLYLDGTYIAQDFQKSYDLLCDAESKGYGFASAYKSLFYCFGYIVEQDLSKAEQLIEKFLDIPDFMYFKGMIYLMQGNQKEAVHWFKKAADLGDQNGLLYLGYAYLNGDGDITQDPVRAFECFMKSASLGNSEAENMLGVSYENGQGTELDEELALYWYQEAAKHNNPSAQNNLANCFKYGWLGLDVDPEKAFELYKKAAEKGIVDAMFEVAEFYNASPLTAHKSVEWYKKAADAGHGDAMFELAQKYESGWNVKQDSAKAQEYYEKAIVAGSERVENHEREQEVLYRSWLDETGQQFREDTPEEVYGSFINSLRDNAQKGDALAQKLLGDCYFFGHGVNENYSEAAEWTRKAAQQGNAYAQFDLAVMLDSGNGVDSDSVEANKWYKKAANQGLADAQFVMGNICLIENDYDGAEKWYRKAAKQGHLSAQSELDNILAEKEDPDTSVLCVINTPGNINYKCWICRCDKWTIRQFKEVVCKLPGFAGCTFYEINFPGIKSIKSEPSTLFGWSGESYADASSKMAAYLRTDASEFDVSRMRLIDSI